MVPQSRTTQVLIFMLMTFGAQPYVMAQQQGTTTATANDGLRKDSPAASIDEIPAHVQQGSAVLRMAGINAAPQPRVQEIERAAAAYEGGFRSLIESTRKTLQDRPSLSLLRQLRSAWEVGRDRLNSWQTVLRGRSVALQKSLSDLRAQEQWWVDIEKVMEGEQVPAVLRTEVETLHNSLNSAKQAVLERRNQVLEVQARVADIQVELDQLDEEVRSALEAERERLLRIDAGPIWSTADQEAEKAKLPARKSEAPRRTKEEVALLREYLRNAGATIVLQVAIFVFMIAGAVVWRRRLRTRLWSLSLRSLHSIVPFPGPSPLPPWLRW